MTLLQTNLQKGPGTEIGLSEEKEMSHRLYPWLRLVLGGTLLFGASAGSCVSDTIRDASDNLNEFADDLDGNNTVDNLGDDIQDWLDQVF